MLGIRYPDSSVITVTSRVVLLPALPILFLFPVPLSAGDDYTWDYEVGAVLSFFSSLAWSMIVGFVFRHDRNA